MKVLLKISAVVALVCCSLTRLVPTAGSADRKDRIIDGDGLDCGSMSIAFLGDSNLWLGGDDCRNPTSWGHHIVKDGAFDRARSFARSGATITNTSVTRADTVHYTELLNDTNTLYNQALRLNGAVMRNEMRSPDLIIVSGGSNDAWFQDRRPGLFEKYQGKIDIKMKPEEATSLRSSLELVIRMLQSVNPDSRIVIVGPPYMTKASPEAVGRVADVMEETALAEKLQMIRLDRRDLIDPEVEARQFTLTRDGAHTLPEGAKLIGDFILGQLCGSQKDSPINKN